MPFTCSICGGPFDKLLIDHGDHVANFCSQKCAEAAGGTTPRRNPTVWRSPPLQRSHDRAAISSLPATDELAKEAELLWPLLRKALRGVYWEAKPDATEVKCTTFAAVTAAVIDTATLARALVEAKAALGPNQQKNVNSGSSLE